MIAIYARVSTEDQAKNGYSLLDQIRACRKLADSCDVAEYIDEGISGEILNRPQLNLLRRAVAEGCISKVICLDPDRLSRKLMNQLIISDEIEKKASLIFVNGEYNKTAEGKLFYQLRGAISEFEKAKINERMSRGRTEKARQGKVVRDYSIYGYSYDSINQKLVVQPFEAEIVKTIFALFTGKLGSLNSINSIANYLSEQKIPTKRGASCWHRQVVRQILMNRAYIGEFYQNRWNCEGSIANKFKPVEDRTSPSLRPKEDWILVPCPMIIELDEFNFAQHLLDQSRRRFAGTSKLQYLLSGLVRCGNCGNTMTGRKSMNWGKKVYQYSDIKGTAGCKNRGCGKRIKTHELEFIVLKEVESFLLKHVSSIDFQPQEILLSSMPFSNLDSIENQLKDISKTRQRLIDSLSFLDETVGTSALKHIKDKLTALNKEEQGLLTIKNDMKNLKTKNYNEINKTFKQLLFDVLGNIESMTHEDKYYLVHSIVKEIIVFDDTIRIIGF